MKKILLPLAFVAMPFASFSADSASLALENEEIQLSASNTGEIQITDKKTNTVWQQARPVLAEDGASSRTQAVASSLPRIDSVKKEGDQIVISAQWQVPLTMRWSLNGKEAVCEISSSEAEKEWTDVEGQALLYPAPFYSEAAKFSVLPEDEGVLYDTSEIDPASGDGPHWGHKRVGRQLSMPWWGVTDYSRGCMTLLDTPYHVNEKLVVCETPDGQRALPSIQWINDRYRLGQPRKVTFAIVSDGGYVAMAKRYREDLKKQGLFKTFEEKARELPAINKLKGAMDLWVFTLNEKPLTAADVKRIRDFGYEKLLFQVFHGLKGDPYRGITEDGVRQARDYGWITGYYHLYSWMYRPNDGSFTPEQLERGMKTRDGYYETKVGPWSWHGLWCPAVLGDPLAEAAAIEKKAGFDVFFTDTTIAGDSLRDCYDPEHPLTIPECATALRKVVEQVNKQGMMVGSERGFWYAASACAFFEGIETIGQYFFQFNGPGAKQSHGGPMNTAAPGYEDLFVGRNYGAEHRVPLFQLVYHDSVLCMRRWDDHHTREEKLWRTNDLMAICYGVAPIVCFYNFNGPHILRDDYEAYNERYMRTYRDVCGWHEQIGFDEMTDHKFLTEDRKVQQTTFSNGKSVIVNFGDERYESNGMTVEPMDYLAK